MTYELPFDDAYEPYHASSPTDRVILELQMYGHRPHQDEPDPAAAARREVIRAGLAGIVETFAGMLGDTRLEPDLDDLLWSFAQRLPPRGRARRPRASTATRTRSVPARASRTAPR